MCSAVSDDSLILRWRPVGEGIEEVTGHRLRSGYEPHSHDSYVVGLTAHGEQRFRYRRAEQCSRPGEAFILHPGEMHDGRPGTHSGYGYGALYVAPRLVAEAIGGGPLPFVAEAVSADEALRAVLARGLERPSGEAGDDLALSEFVADLAAALLRLSGRDLPRTPAHYATLRAVREELDAAWRQPPGMAALEAAHGISRFTIARQFRTHFGISPSRYVILRRLDHVRQRIAKGDGLADAALAAGFSDQSHMSRHFLGAFGLTPGRWRAALRSTAGPSAQL